MDRRSIFNEKEAVEAGAHGGRGGRVHVRGRRRWYREPRGTSPTLLAQEPRDGRCPRKAHRTTGAQTTEPGHHNGEFVNDVRVSPIDEGVDVVEEDELSRAARRPRTGVSASPPRSRLTSRSRRRDGQNSGHRAPRGCPADLLLGAPWVHFVSEEYQEVSLREPGENDSARAPNFKCREITICRNSLPPATIPLTRYENCSSKSGACVDL